MTRDAFLDPPTFDTEDVAAILRWADLRPEVDPLLAAGAGRNAMRHANAWGLKVLATLLRGCPAMDPGHDPVEVLKHLLASRDEPTFLAAPSDTEGR
jgi:hypothetical protein